DAEGNSPPPKLLMPMRQVAKPSAPTLTHLGRQELRRCQCTAKLLLDFEFALGIAHCGVPLTAPIIQVGRFRGRENAVALCTDCIDVCPDWTRRVVGGFGIVHLVARFTLAHLSSR